MTPSPFQLSNLKYDEQRPTDTKRKGCQQKKAVGSIITALSANEAVSKNNNANRSRDSSKYLHAVRPLRLKSSGHDYSEFEDAARQYLNSDHVDA
ncbi:hypothetical protein [Methylobacterium sp. JK268]